MRANLYAVLIGLIVLGIALPVSVWGQNNTDLRPDAPSSVTKVQIPQNNLSGLSAQAAPSRSEWKQFVMATLADAERFASRESTPSGRAMSLLNIASAWRKLDPSRARKLLERAWQESEKDPDLKDRGYDQVNIILDGWAALDVERAKKLASRIPDTQWQTIETLAEHVAIADMEKGVPLLNAIPDLKERAGAVYRASYALMEEEEPERGARLVRKVKGINQEETLSHVLLNIASKHPKTAQSLLRFLSSSQRRDQVTLVSVEASAFQDPVEAEKLARQIREKNLQANALAIVAAAFRARDTSHAHALVAEAIPLAQGISSYDLKLWTVVEMAPYLAQVDVPQTRDLLEPITLAASTSSESAVFPRAKKMLRLAGAWSWVDTARAETLFEDALKRKDRVYLDDSGQFLDGSFIQYLTGLARKQPERAAALFRRYSESTQGVEMMQDKILTVLARENFDTARQFVACSGGLTAETKLVQQTLADKARAYPAQSETLLAQISYGGLRDEAARDIALKLAVSDPDAARRIAQSISFLMFRTEAFRALGSRLIRQQPAEALKFLKEAAMLAHSPDDPAKADHLADIAATVINQIPLP